MARRKLAKYVYSVSRAVIGDRLTDHLKYPPSLTLGVLPWFRLQSRYGRLVGKVVPHHFRDTNFANFTSLLEASAFDEEGIHVVEEDDFLALIGGYSRHVLVLDQFQATAGKGDGVAEHVYALAVSFGPAVQAVQLVPLTGMQRLIPVNLPSLACDVAVSGEPVIYPVSVGAVFLRLRKSLIEPQEGAPGAVSHLKVHPFALSLPPRPNAGPHFIEGYDLGQRPSPASISALLPCDPQQITGLAGFF